MSTTKQTGANDNDNNSVEVKPYTLGELATIYSVKPRTMRLWINKHENVIKKRVGHYFTARQVKLIFQKLGLPGLAED